MADRLPGGGRVVLPFGDYAFYPSGMEVGGLCWYRLLPGYEGTDPISLAKAVVQVGDLLDDLDCRAACPDRLRPGRGGGPRRRACSSRRRPAVVCTDTPRGPCGPAAPALLDAGRPRVLLLRRKPGRRRQATRRWPRCSAPRLGAEYLGPHRSRNAGGT